jgi:dihydrofolate reductase
MRKLIVFNHVSLDGYFVGENGDSSWAHVDNDDPEFLAFVAENAKGDAQLLFGRITYQMMESFWPTPMAKQRDPVVAARMNAMPKVVFSKTLDKVSWENTTLLKGDPATEVRKLKEESGPGMAIMGSGRIISLLAQQNLVDEYQLVVNPVVLGKGRTMFEGLQAKVKLKLAKSRTFKNGKVFLSLVPEGK